MTIHTIGGDMSISKKLEALKVAEDGYQQAKMESSAASSRETAALNRLNEAQRAFDAEVSTVRKDSPGGDWKTRDRGRVSK